jgi:uncharacterized membrane protein YkvA (DUF1232 family)
MNVVMLEAALRLAAGEANGSSSGYPDPAYSEVVSGWEWVAVGLGATLVIYAAFIIALLVAGRRSDARALAGFIPDCIVLFRRLLADDRIPRSRKALIFALIGYLALPFDLVPDFIPVAGQLDDAILVAVVLRMVLRTGGPDLLTEHWPGPQSSRDMIVRFAFGRAATVCTQGGVTTTATEHKSRLRSTTREPRGRP